MKYFTAQIKRVLRYLPLAVIISLVLALLFSLFVLNYLNEDAAADDKQILRIGMVGDTSSTFLGFGIEFIKEADSSNMMLSLEQMTETEAHRMLIAGEISAYIRVPDGFVDAASRGDVMQLDYVTSDVSGGITSLFKEEILSAVSRMLVHSQKGIYSMQELVLSHGIRENYGKNTDELVLRYFNLIIKRPSLLKLDVRGISDGVDLVTYLACGLSVLCLALFGIPYCSVFVKKDTSLARLAVSRGISLWKQTVYEFFAYLFALAVTAFVVLFGVALVGIMPFYDTLRLFALCVPVLVLIAALHYLGFTLADNIASAVTLQFFGMIVLSYVCGCIYPISFFPRAIQLIGGFLPLGAARAYVVSAVCGDIDAAGVILCIGYSLLLIMISVAVNRRKAVFDR